MSTPDFTAPAHFLPHRIRITNALVWLPSTFTADTNIYHNDNSKSNLFCQRKMSTSSTTAPLKSCKRPPLSTNLPLRSCANVPRRRSGRVSRRQVSWVRGWPLKRMQFTFAVDIREHIPRAELLSSRSLASNPQGISATLSSVAWPRHCSPLQQAT